jgi:hypothetical protein
MQTRYRAAATALLLTATAGMAAIGGAAQAVGSHHAGAGALKTKTITITNKTGAVKLSDDTIRPGNTIFKVKNLDGKAAKGLIQVFRLRDGYTLGDAFADLPTLFSNAPDVPTVNRIDDNIIFYGGMETKQNPSKVSEWAVKLGTPGTYYVANFDQQQLTTLTVKGALQKRGLPKQTGVINAAVGPHGVGNAFKPGKNIATSGWMSTTNGAQEPHFVDLTQVKKGTTNADITAVFQGGPDPSVKGGGSTGTGVISPGHRFLWSYDLPQGRYAVMCFWPSKTDGMPHAVMGMHAVFNIG